MNVDSVAGRRQTFLLLLIIAVASVFRLTALDWDGYQHYHPDERYITWVATTVDFPNNLSTAFRPHSSSFNPFYWPPEASSEGIVVLQDQPRSFAYGHLPLYLGVAATRVAEKLSPLGRYLPAHWSFTEYLLNHGEYNEFQHLTAVSRALTAVFDLGTVLLIFLLGKHLCGPAIGLLAAAFLAVNVMHIQLARFFAVDPYLTFFVVAAVYAGVRLYSARTKKEFWRFLLVASLAIGMAVGSKFSAVMLMLPLTVALFLRKRSDDGAVHWPLLVAILIISAIFALTNPFALLDWTCDVVSPAVSLGPLRIPSLNWGSCYLDNVLRQSSMVRGNQAFDFTRQYTNTLPYLYPLMMQLRWGMGYILGTVAIAAFGWVLWRGVRQLPRERTRSNAITSRMADGGGLVVLSWTLPYFLVTGGFFTKFMRYMQPLTPFLMLYAAAFLISVLRGRQRRFAAAIVLTGTLVYAIAFLSMYRQLHPWNEVSRWLYANAEHGALIASELWDDPLPSSMQIDGVYYNRHIYEYTELNWLSGASLQDDEEKLKLNLSRVAQADYLTISSNRGYGVVGRLSELYPLSHQYYERLFSGDLGFEVVKVAGRSPRLGDLWLWPDRFADTDLPTPMRVREFLDNRTMIMLGKADESFTVYDQPLAIIFQNRRHLTVEEMLAQFDLQP